MASQLPFLANQIQLDAASGVNLFNKDNNRLIMHRSVTDLSIDLDGEIDILGTSEIHKLQVQVREFTLKLLETKVILILLLTDNKVVVYEGMAGFKHQDKERFRFKLV